MNEFNIEYETSRTHAVVNKSTGLYIGGMTFTECVKWIEIYEKENS